MINFDWKLCRRICNFLFCLFHAFKCAVSGYSSAKPKVSRSLLMEWASFLLCTKHAYIAFQKRVWVFQRCRCVFILLLVFFGAIWLFIRVDLAFLACDYLATLRTSRFVATCYENVWTTTGFCDMKNLPSSLSRHARSKNNIQNQNCSKNVWKRNDILWLSSLWTNRRY